jgi:cytochrome P460
MRKISLAIGFIIVCALIGIVAAQKPAPADAPQYTSDGRLNFPANYREWVFLSSGVGMSYTPSASSGAADPSFDNVFAAPSAYQSFQRTGTWPDKTVLVLEGRSSHSKGSINQTGHYQADLQDIEAEVKDTNRFPGKWAFFPFGRGNAPAKQIPVSASCYSCHATNAALDNTFVQFYPTLLAIAKSKGTLKSVPADR